MLTVVQTGDLEHLTSHLAVAKAAGLGITLRIAEVLFRVAFCESV